MTTIGDVAEIEKWSNVANSSEILKLTEEELEELDKEWAEREYDEEWKLRR